MRNIESTSEKGTYIIWIVHAPITDDAPCSKPDKSFSTKNSLSGTFDEVMRLALVYQPPICGNCEQPMVIEPRLKTKK